MAKVLLGKEFNELVGPEMAMDTTWVDLKLRDGRVIKRAVLRGRTYLTGVEGDPGGEGPLDFASEDIVAIRRSGWSLRLFPGWKAPPGLKADAKAQDLWNQLHPDLVESGGLALAAQAELKRLGATDIQVEGHGDGWAQLQLGGRRNASLAAVAHERAFSVAVWAAGVQHGTGLASDLAPAVRAIAGFLKGASDARSLADEFSWFEPAEGLAEYEAGPQEYVAFVWRRLLTWVVEDEPTGSSMKTLAPLLQAAAAHPDVQTLFPFTSHAQLCFSQFTGFSYPDDCPHAYAVGTGRFRVCAPPPNGEQEVVLGEGDAAEAVRLIVANLPAGWAAAQHGTSED